MKGLESWRTLHWGSLPACAIPLSQPTSRRSVIYLSSLGVVEVFYMEIIETPFGIIISCVY